MKICIHCKEEMKPDARVCPHCQRTQSRLDTRDPRTAIVIFVVPAVLIIGALLVGQHYFRNAIGSIDATSTAVTNGAVVVSETSFSFVPSSCGPQQQLVFIGKLHNASSHRVKDPKVIVSFYDSSHHLVDVVTESNWQTIIAAGGEMSFRATSTPKAKPTDYVSFDTQVVGGRDLD